MKQEETEPKNRLFDNIDLMHLFLPIVVEQGLEYMVGLADSLMVAQVGESAVSGVSLVDFVMALLISVFAALATGGSVVAGQFLGKKDTESAKKTGNQLIRLATLFSIGIMLALYLAKPLILNHLFGSITGEVYAAADTYLMIVALSIPFLALYNCGAAIFRTTGNSRLPMKIMLAMNMLNVVGNAILVLAFHMGVAGIAIPTLVSRIGAAVIILYLAGKNTFSLQVRGWFRTQFDKKNVRQILGIGAPFALENGMFYLGRLIVLSIV